MPWAVSRGRSLPLAVGICSLVLVVWLKTYVYRSRTHYITIADGAGPPTWSSDHTVQSGAECYINTYLILQLMMISDDHVWRRQALSRTNGGSFTSTVGGVALGDGVLMAPRHVTGNGGNWGHGGHGGMGEMKQMRTFAGR